MEKVFIPDTDKPRELLPQKTVYPVLFAISISHFLNDLQQAVLPAIYPILKGNLALTFSQVGLITLIFQLTASLLQPFIGSYTDKNPKPYSLAAGMLSTFAGIILLAFATNYALVLAAAAFIGIGSSVFHPTASKVAYHASGGKRGLAQSIFQLGGNGGSAAGPLLAALIIIPLGRYGILSFALAALIAVFVLLRVGKWYARHLRIRAAGKINTAEYPPRLSRKKVLTSVGILLLLIFSKYFYTASISSYFTFYLMDKFGLSVQQSQIYLFIFSGSVAAGTFLGGPLGDKFGRKIIIWVSILGAAPFTLLLPYADLFWTGVLAALTGVILASAFSAILVYAQELLPGKVGMISGLFFGFAFGMGGLGSALLGVLADHMGVAHVFMICSFLPLIGIFTAFLPELKK